MVLRAVFIALFAGLFTCQGVISQDIGSPGNINRQFSVRGEVYFRFSNDLKNLTELLENHLSIDHKTDDKWVYTYANQKGYKAFQAEGIPHEILPAPSTDIERPLMKADVDISDSTGWDFYPTYEAYVDIMYQFQAEYPGLCSVFSIGQSVNGRELLIARISDNAGYEPGEAQFLYTSTIHGDEVAGYVLMLHLIDYLLKNYGSDPTVTNLVNNLDIWINPLANPDGTYHDGNNTVYGSTRFNAHNIDLNRNFPDPEDGPHPDGEDYQPETIAFMELADENHFVMAANFHGGAEVFNYPWDTWQQLHADTDWWRFTGREWADTIHKYSPAGYFDDLENGITNGYAWYTTSGNRQDYMNYSHHCREATIELSLQKVLAADSLPSWWEYDYRSFLQYMSQALYGFQGVIKDKGTENPLEATVFLINHDKDGSYVLSNPDNGWFFRPVYAGTWDIKIMADGFKPEVFTGMEINNYSAIMLDALLGTMESDQLVENFSVGPNPFKDRLFIRYHGNEKMNVNFRLIDQEGNIVDQDSETFDSGNKLHVIDLKTHNSFVFLLSAEGDDFEHTWKIIKSR